MRPRPCLSLLFLSAAAAATSAPCAAEDGLDALGEQLTFVSEASELWARLSSVSDVTAYVAEDPPPGLVFSDESPLVAPRVSLTLDAGWGARLLGRVRARADRGFDPGADEDGEVRLDEYFLELDLGGAARTRIRVGRFPTAFGDWVNRHLAWDNPLITAPVLYEDMIAITDAAAPADRAAFLARRDAPENKPAWVPVVWGPSYATGAAISAGAGAFDVTVEVKNASLSSRPQAWNDGFASDPTFTARVGWHPRPEWTAGLSVSRGPYLRDAAEATLPAGTHVDDFDQTTIGADLTFEHRRLQLWAELAHSRFEVPRVGAVETIGGFVEARYKLAPRLWLAGRLNHTWFGQVDGVSWDRNVTRADVGVGFRFTPHTEIKLECSVGDQAGGDTHGNRLLAAQAVVWF